MSFFCYHNLSSIDLPLEGHANSLRLEGHSSSVYQADRATSRFVEKYISTGHIQHDLSFGASSYYADGTVFETCYAEAG